MPAAPSRHSRVESPSSGVFTDGACLGNPGPGGWAYAWVVDDEILAEDAGSEARTTNNRMELRALVEAFRRLPADARVSVYSDSRLCVDTLNQWAPRWRERGWKRKGGPIANLDLVRELYDLAEARPGARLRWIKAHAGARWNEYVDSQASRRASLA